MPESAGSFLDGRVVLICGATGQIGSAMVRKLSAHGARVVIQYHRASGRAHALAAELGLDRDLQIFGADLTDPGETDNLLHSIQHSLGPVGAVINCVHGPSDPKLVRDMTWADWGVHLDALRVQVNLCRASLPQLRLSQDGRIIFVSGALAVRYYAGCAAYSTIKAGLEAFCRTLALEEGNNGVTVNIISPGMVRDPSLAEPEDVPGFEEIDRLSRQRMALALEPTADDVAETALFLVSPWASQITGQTMYLTGGEVMQ